MDNSVIKDAFNYASRRTKAKIVDGIVLDVYIKYNIPLEDKLYMSHNGDIYEFSAGAIYCNNRYIDFNLSSDIRLLELLDILVNPNNTYYRYGNKLIDK